MRDEEPRDVAQTLHHLVELYEKESKHEQAQTLYEQSPAIQEHSLGAEHPDAIATREALTGLLQMLHSPDQQSHYAQQEKS